MLPVTISSQGNYGRFLYLFFACLHFLRFLQLTFFFFKADTWYIKQKIYLEGQRDHLKLYLDSFGGYFLQTFENFCNILSSKQLCRKASPIITIARSLISATLAYAVYERHIIYGYSEFSFSSEKFFSELAKFVLSLADVNGTPNEVDPHI